jgi:hypothetical protein
MNRLFWWCSLVLMLVTGCGGGGRPEVSPAPDFAGGAKGGAFPVSAQAAPGSGRSSLDGETTASLDAPPPPPAAPPATLSSESQRAPSPELAPSPQPRERPGLGTEWGEQRESRVHDVSFARADRDRPFALATLHYNDREGVAALAAFHGERSRETSAAGGAISVAIDDGTGEALEALHVGDRTYVIGQSGERYTIVLTNHTSHRFEAVATVDGLDVINGKPGTMQNRGYVLMPFATLTIDGFRQSQDSVAAFRFSKVSDSYAAQVGKARNVGVIGVAFFSEQGDAADWTRGELERRDTANPFPGTDSRFARPPR